ncbi:MAG: sensor histidine kinase [Actinophytocola sp.]|uniref:sensor histidine kinase n=1 Tax=Actinophytocola sp. TaxID=1872138 RepID=UPI003D6A1D4F
MSQVDSVVEVVERAPGIEVVQPSPPPPARTPANGTRWPLRRIIDVSVGVLAVFCVAAIAVGTVALAKLADARAQVVERIDPALQQAQRLEAALVNQETGVRGYSLGAERDLLEPYPVGLAAEADAVERLEPALGEFPAAARALRETIDRADNWRASYAEPAIAVVDTTGEPTVTTTSVDSGRIYFDAVRSSVGELQADLADARAEATAALATSATTLNVVCVVIAGGFAMIVLALAVGLRRVAIQPVSRLAAEVRTVAGGDFSHRVEQSGPTEVHDLGADVNMMRERILHELSALQAAHAELDARTQDLERSNAELEQFAYVASHDLQEPLRKVASFCQLLQRRYSGQLDERADQYIEFAVDGAKRMQDLINDLLAFSRVGRIVREPTEVSCSAVLEQAKVNLTTTIEQSGAAIEAGELPTVRAEVPLLTAVFQNLVSNALKFRGEDPPHIVVDAHRDGEFWEFSFTDNGIGIEPDYADRIFVIFQRLHGKGDYPGTGIGLAMCRKIIEYHGGRIWLDTEHAGGARFRFTLPALAGSTDEETDTDD